LRGGKARVKHAADGRGGDLADCGAARIGHGDIRGTRLRCATAHAMAGLASGSALLNVACRSTADMAAPRWIFRQPLLPADAVPRVAPHSRVIPEFYFHVLVWPVISASVMAYAVGDNALTISTPAAFGLYAGASACWRAAEGRAQHEKLEGMGCLFVASVPGEDFVPSAYEEQSRDHYRRAPSNAATL